MNQINPGTNRRRHARYEFQTEGKYSVYSRGEVVQTGTARTLNLSASGLCLALDRPAASGSKIEVNLLWPGVYHDAERARLIVTGQIVRVEGVRAAVRTFAHRFHVAAVGVAAPQPIYRRAAPLVPPRPAA